MFFLSFCNVKLYTMYNRYLELFYEIKFFGAQYDIFPCCQVLWSFSMVPWIHQTTKKWRVQQTCYCYLWWVTVIVKNSFIILRILKCSPLMPIQLQNLYSMYTNHEVITCTFRWELRLNAVYNLKISSANLMHCS